MTTYPTICRACPRVLQVGNRRQGLCNRCYARQRDAALPPLASDAPGARLRACREAHGWSLAVVAAATHYSKGVLSHYERGRNAVPPDLCAWLERLPAVRQVGTYPPTCGGLRGYLRDKRLRVIELAAFTGAAESTVRTWLIGTQGLPLPIRAWLRAGAPPDWHWTPPELSGRRYRPNARCGDRPAKRRDEAHRRPLQSLLIRRWERVAKPRPRRRQAGAA